MESETVNIRQKRKVNFCVFCCFLSCSSLFLYYRQSTSTSYPLVLVYYSSQRKRVSLLLLCEQRYRAVSSCPNGRPYIYSSNARAAAFAAVCERTVHIICFFFFFVCMCVEESIYSYSFLLIFFFLFFWFFGRFPSSHLIWRNKQRHPSSSSHHICWFVDNFLYRNLDVSRMSCFIVRLYTICIVGERTGVTMSLAFQLLFTFFLCFCFLLSIASSRPIFNRLPTFRRTVSAQKNKNKKKRDCFVCVVLENPPLCIHLNNPEKRRRNKLI